MNFVDDPDLIINLSNILSAFVFWNLYIYISIHYKFTSII
jgi:hypothetical protein